MMFWRTWLDAWKDGSSMIMKSVPEEFPQDALDILSLGLLASGKADAATLRQARFLGKAVFLAHPEIAADEDLRFLLLLVLTRLRAGCPQSSLEELRALLEPVEPDEEYDQLDVEKLLQAWRDAEDGLQQKLSGLFEDRRIFQFVPVVGDGTEDPMPLLCLSGNGEEMVITVAHQEAALRKLERNLQTFLKQSDTGISDETAGRILQNIKDKHEKLDKEQAAAVWKALHSRFMILTGGPGTGKTTVVACILEALLQTGEIGVDEIALAAPTGRAQARLAESVAKKLGVSVQASTLHSLLTARPDGSFRYNVENRLPQKVIVVDEASMIDLGMFSALMEAVSPDAHFILVGDPRQLPSVEAGAVLADFMEASLLEGKRVELLHTHRNQGQIVEAANGIQDGIWGLRRKDGEIREVTHAAALNFESLEPGMLLHLDMPLDDLLTVWVDRWKEQMNFGQILCATHKGPNGRETVNRICHAKYAGRQDSGRTNRFLEQEPVILGRNLPEFNLWNGDLGNMNLRGSEAWAIFDGNRQHPAVNLEGLETAWAITVHKSQGSEFPVVLFILPDRDTPLMTRQIIYTALTRAKVAALIWGNEELLKVAAGRSEERPSRLKNL